MAAKKGNKYASFNNTERFMNKKKEIGCIMRSGDPGEYAQLLNLISLEY